METITITCHARNGAGALDFTIIIRRKQRAPELREPVPEIEWSEGEPFPATDVSGYFTGSGLTFNVDNAPEGFAMSQAGVLTGPAA